jgi:hypothetical protein
MCLTNKSSLLLSKKNWSSKTPTPWWGLPSLAPTPQALEKAKERGWFDADAAKNMGWDLEDMGRFLALAFSGVTLDVFAAVFSQHCGDLIVCTCWGNVWNLLQFATKLGVGWFHMLQNRKNQRWNEWLTITINNHSHTFIRHIIISAHKGSTTTTQTLCSTTSRHPLPDDVPCLLPGSGGTSSCNLIWGVNAK